MVDGHGQKSSDIVKTTFHEGMMTLPLVSDEAIENDRRRTSQAYPGSIVRAFWELMQSPSTRNGLLSIKIFHYLSPILNIEFIFSATQGTFDQQSFGHGLSQNRDIHWW